MTIKTIVNKHATCCIFQNILDLLGVEIKSDKQKAILEASYNLFTEKGYHDTTIDDIAHAAKVGKGTIYNYFTDKEAILMFLLDKTMKNAITMLKKIDVSKPLAAFEEYVVVGFHNMIDIAPLMMQCMNVGMVFHDHSNRHKLSEDISAVKKVLEDILHEGKKQKLFNDTMGEDVPMHFVADNLHNVIKQYMISLVITNPDHKKLRNELDKYAKKLSNIILYGITSKPQEEI